MEILYVITNNDELQYVEFDEVKTPKEIMIEKLQKSDKVKEIYEGISNFGPIGLLWKKEENEDDEAEEERYKALGNREVSEEDYEEDHDYELDALRERDEKGLNNDFGWSPEDDEEDIHKKVMFDSCMNDADTTTLDALIEDEVEAIKAYDKAIKEAQFEEAIGIYEHIKGEEEEHLKELMELKERVSRG